MGATNNKLLALEQSMRTRRSGMPARPAASKAQGLWRRKVHQFATPVSYDVPGIVPAMEQPNMVTCWAAATAMLYSWKDDMSYPIESVLDLIGSKWTALFKKPSIIPYVDLPVFVAAAGMVAEPPQCFPVKEWERLLHDYGPLMLITYEMFDIGPGAHVRVITGIHGDGTPKGTFLTVNDPLGKHTSKGKLNYTESVDAFSKKYDEIEVRRQKGKKDSVLQVIHFPAGIKSATARKNNQATAESVYSFEVEEPMVGEPLCMTEGVLPEQVEEKDRISFATSFNMPTPAELEKLLKYLKTDYATFAPHEGRYFDTMKMHLERHGILSSSDTLNRTNFIEALKSFQSSKGLKPDGIPGEDTLWELQSDWAEARNLDTPNATADKVAGFAGYSSFRLRDDVVDRYNKVYNEIHDAGGVITSAGSLRALSANVTAGRSSKSIHYAGVALDLSTVTGMTKRKFSTAPYIITQEDGRHWRVWARSQKGAEKTLDAIVWNGGSTTVKQLTEKVIDVTAVFEKNGFRRIGHRKCFPNTYLCAEWWHFQCEAALVPFMSQFGCEVASLKRNSMATLKAHEGIWKNRKAIFKRSWF